MLSAIGIQPSEGNADCLADFIYSLPIQTQTLERCWENPKMCPLELCPGPTILTARPSDDNDDAFVEMSEGSG